MKTFAIEFLNYRFFFNFLKFSSSNFAFFCEMLMDFFRISRQTPEKSEVCRFSINFAKTKFNELENYRNFWKCWKLIIIQFYSILFNRFLSRHWAAQWGFQGVVSGNDQRALPFGRSRKCSKANRNKKEQHAQRNVTWNSGQLARQAIRQGAVKEVSEGTLKSLMHPEVAAAAFEKEPQQATSSATHHCDPDDFLWRVFQVRIRTSES